MNRPPRLDFVGYVCSVLAVGLVGLALVVLALMTAKASGQEYRNVIVAHNVGWSGGFPSGWNDTEGRERLRNIGRGITTKGYEAWVMDEYPPLIDRGFRRFVVQNPAGVNASEPMDFDQWRELELSWWRLMREDDRLARLSRFSYAQAWGQLRSAYPELDIEVIDYLGAISEDPDMVALADNPRVWNWRAGYSIGASLDAGNRIAFDASYLVAEGSKEHRFIQQAESFGADPVIEAWPPRTSEHLHGFDVFMVTRPGNGGSYASYWSHPNSPRGLLRGEVMVLLQGAWNDNPDEFVERVKQIYADGHTPVVGSGQVWLWLRHFGGDE